MRLRCFFYLSRACGAYFFELAIVAMCSKWSSSLESTQPPDGSSRFFFVGSRRVFASSTNTCFLSGCRLCSSHRSHPGCLDRELVEAVSEAFFRWGLWLSPLMASGEMALFLLQNVLGRRPDIRRGFAIVIAIN